MLDTENSANPDDDKKVTISLWKDIADYYCPSSDDILKVGSNIMELGIKAKDALHLACAVSSGCDYFITTDDKLNNKIISGIRIINPIDFVREMEA
jgi:predicted nucleic acid-binding protein